MFFNGFLSLVVCALVFFLNFNKKMYDSFLKTFSMIWLFYIGLYLVSSKNFVPISDEFDTVFLAFFLSSIFFYSIILFFLKLSKLKGVSFKSVISTNIYYFISFILTFFSIFKFIYYIAIFGLSDYRQTLLDNDLSISVGLSFPFLMGAYYIAEKNNQQKVKIISIIFLFVLGIISTSKIFIVIMLLYISGFYKKNFSLNWYKITKIFVAGFLIYSLLHVLMGKIAGATGDNFFGIVDGLIFTFIGYLLGGLAVFQLQLNGQYIPSGYFSNVFNFLINMPVNNSMVEGGDWVYTGSWLGNVKSGFSTWYQFFGIIGMVYLGLLIGFIYAFIFYFSKKSISLNFIKIFSFYPLMFFIFNDTFLGASKIWIVYILVVFILSITNFNKVFK